MSDRQSIYYWKCDRASAFYALQKSQSAYAGTELELPLYKVLSRFLGDDTFVFRPAGGQGNHLTYIVNHQHTDYFVRLENGPERDGYMAVEARILDEVRAIGVPTPAVFYVDASRQQLPFAIQIMTHIRYSDLNSLNKKGSLNVCRIANEIGQAVARWQTLTPNGFGPFHASILREEGKLVGLHATYADYFLLNLTRHLSFLSDHHFLTIDEAKALSTIVEQHKHYLDLDLGCLVHKDLALWNILGTPTTIEAFIDWDDCIVGDPTDDLSLLACFHDREFLTAALEGYLMTSGLVFGFICCEI